MNSRFFRIFDRSFITELDAKIDDNFQPTKFIRNYFQPMCKIVPRIKEIAINEGITIGALERAIGASKGVISRAITNGTDIQAKWLEAIIENYPRYSSEWLIAGRGEMIKSAENLISRHHPEVDSSQSDIPNIAKTATPFLTDIADSSATKNTPGAIPLVSEKAAGGLINDENMNINERDVIGYYVIPKFRHLGVDFMIEVIGDSMMPRLFPGDIIACSILHNPQFIQWNKPHLLATRDQGLIVKRLRKSAMTNCILAVSDNSDYEPFDIPKDDILGIARIVGVIHLE